MADGLTMALDDVLRQAQALMELDVSRLGADCHELTHEPMACLEGLTF